MRRRDFLGSTSAWAALSVAEVASAADEPASASRALRRSRGGNLTSLDPHRPLSSADMEVAADLFIGLTAINAAGEIVPGCAQSWRVEAGGRRYRFKLQPGLLWSDGRVLSAEDVLSSLRRLLDPATGALLAYRYDAIRGAQAIRAGEASSTALGVRLEGASDIVIELERPETDLLRLLAVAYIVPAHAITRFGRDWAKPPNMIVNGAYRPLSWAQNGRLELVRNQQFRALAAGSSGTPSQSDMRVAPAAVDWLFGIDDATRLRLFRAGELDIAQISEGSALALAQRELPAQLKSVPSHTGGWVGFNLRNPSLADRRLRNLLALATDRDTLCEKVRALGEQPTESLVPFAATDYPERARPAHPGGSIAERRQAATRLAGELGLSRRAPLRLQAIFSSNSLTQRTFLALDAMWAPFGVRIDARGLESRAYSEALNARRFDLMDYSIFSVVQGAASFINRFRSDSFLNYFGYAEPEVDALIDAAEREPTPSARARGYLAAERRILRDLPVIPLYSGVAHRLISARVSGWVRNPGLATPSHYLGIGRGVLHPVSRRLTMAPWLEG
jgi:oligopeptide transport system substrate-binding protein